MLRVRKDRFKIKVIYLLFLFLVILWFLFREEGESIIYILGIFGFFLKFILFCVRIGLLGLLSRLVSFSLGFLGWVVILCLECNSEIKWSLEGICLVRIFLKFLFFDCVF